MSQNIKKIIAQEYIKCAKNPAYFMRKYCYIQHPTRGRILFNLYPFQEKVLNLYKEKDFKPLLKWIDEKLLEYTNNLNINFKPLNKYAWFQIYENGDYQEYHIHPTSKLSAIYFLKGKKNSAPVLFTDFNFNMNYFNLITPTEDNSFEWNIPFQEGVLLIFRSEIQHCVPISIAINYDSI